MKYNPLPSSIGNLEKLEKLYFTSDKLSLLPSEIGKLLNLQELYLNDN